MKSRQMYRENVLDHYRNPRNEGSLEDADVHEHDSNPNCGDVIDVYATVEGGVLKEIRFEGEGCAISQAAMSMISQEVKGKQVEEIQDIEKDRVLDLLGIELTPIRLKCALLGIKTLQKGLSEVNYE